MIIFILEIECSRQKLWLKVKENESGELSYSLRSLSGVSHALSNLQLQQPLPVWRGEPVKICAQMIARIIDRGVYRHVLTTYPPGKEMFDPDSHWDDHPDYPASDWMYEVSEGDTRLGYVDWVNNEMEVRENG